ncbi:MBL fold metallo-hydrolase [Conexibacter sp. SYSU D00693]|uniref:MBL fold metallo-hydrolase n=1 Tax=Conexibacter sp. SYSU D00693 TaxID=2812560 RepID=UPI00196A443A|nr:MBL fold metallo-hydrolase [Conexibacter sp. SYSU D00693]
MQVEELAEGVARLALMPRDGVNAYLLGDVLVDAGYPRHGAAILRALDGRDVTAHALTHAHPDHAGGSRTVVERLGVPLWVGARDRAACEAGSAEAATGVRGKLGAFPKVAVDRDLHEGDDLAAGFTVLDAPGHSSGHVAFWREADRTLVAGDVFFNLSLLTLRHGLRDPPGLVTIDPAENRRSQRKLADLDPELVLLGHGPPVRGRGALDAYLRTRGR